MRRNAQVGVLVNTQAFVHVIIMGDDTVVLKQEQLGPAARAPLGFTQRIAYSECQPGARIDIGNQCIAITGTGKRALENRSSLLTASRQLPYTLCVCATNPSRME